MRLSFFRGKIYHDLSMCHVVKRLSRNHLKLTFVSLLRVIGKISLLENVIDNICFPAF